MRFPVSRVNVVVFSGGMDSFTLLNAAVFNARPYLLDTEVIALSFNYGQKHSRELEVAQGVTRRLGLRHEIVDLRDINRLVASALTRAGQEVPEGHYADENMKKTVVPGRNAIMLSVAAGFAESVAAERDCTARLFYGAHSGDHAIYPDCRPEFVEAMKAAILRSSDGRVLLEAPFLDLDKGKILGVGGAVGLSAMDYRATHTCYKGTEIPCGKCGACVERAEAFASVGWRDPLVPMMPEVAGAD